MTGKTPLKANHPVQNWPWRPGWLAARALLVHVSNCDGLNILAERLSPQQLDKLAEYYQAARDAGVPLLRWADTIRKN